MARVMFPIFTENSDPVAFGGRILPGSRGSGEVQELRGHVDLRQVEDAVRPELGQGEHRRHRPGDRLRGLHRRHRLPPRRRAAGRGDVRHGAHRGPRAPAEALRQQGGAGVRRRRRRAGRRRPVLRVGAALRGRGQRRPVPRRPGSGRAERQRPRGARRGGGRGPAVPRLPRAAGARRPGAVVAGGARSARRPGDAGGQRAPRRQRPWAVRRAGRGARRPAGARPASTPPSDGCGRSSRCRRCAAADRRRTPSSWPSPCCCSAGTTSPRG